MHRITMYSPLRSLKNDKYPVSPFVFISIGTHTKNEDGNLLLSPELKTDSEIDYEVDELIKEIQEFRKKAKKELKNLQDKMLAK